ncbi:MAG: amidohydrolase family protein [Armatimonadota bacterium]|nr:amidohydrolase family protein [Armatimonadota bacterium]
MTPQTLAGRDPWRGVPVEITVEGDRIARVRPIADAEVPAGRWVLPGLVDVQVNGFAGTDLNGTEIDVAGVGRVVRRLQAVGVTRFCPTICTQSHERMTRALRVIADACRTHLWIARAVAGIHVEGPYLSPEDGPRGAHPLEHVRPPDWDEFQAFQDAAGGRVRILTLSPEWPQAPSFIRKVAGTGVLVAIGHTAASPENIREAVVAGARLSTHLGNGSHAMLPRHPNYIWEQLGADELSASIISDGHHLPPSVVKTFVRAKGVERTILISDAVALAGMPPGDYDWLGLRVTLSSRGRISLTGTPYLAGSALELASALPKVMAYAGVSLADAVTMACGNPARLLGVDPGVLAEGARGDVIEIDYELGSDRVGIRRVVVAGEMMAENV